MTIWNAIILGLVQGIAEFLPISSSGHLAILQNLFGMTTTENGHMFFDVLLHFGTLISICIVYWEDIVSMFRELAAYSHRGRADDGQTHYPAARLFLMIVLGTLPLFLVLPVNDYVEQLYYHTAFIGIALIITGGILYAADHMAQGRKTEGGMRVKDALIIGLCQAVATIPGISRSGSTIAAGMATGLRRDFAVKYSFLLSLPAVLGANILSLIKAIKAGIDASLIPAYLIGMAVAMVSGVFAIGLVKAIVNKGKFGYFSYYCWTVGLLAIVLSFIF
jgi:undecaprenyl-diphosphatase